MESFEWDPKIKQAMESIDWSGNKNNTEDKDIATKSMLSMIGCEPNGLLMEIMKPDKIENPIWDDLILPQPILSSFDVKQQSNYLCWKEKFKLNQNIASVERQYHQLYRTYLTLHQSIRKEQAEFIEYAYQNALHNIKDYDQVFSHIEHYVKHYLQNSKSKMLKRKLLYTLNNNSIAINVTPFTSDPMLKNEKQLVAMADVPLLQLPTNFPQTIPKLKVKETTGWSICDDPNVKRLSQKWKADVAISMNALATLINNPAPFDNEWEIPVVIEQNPMDKRRNIVFVDKSLPPKSMNGRKRNYLYFKKAVKTIFHRNTENSRSKTKENSPKNKIRNLNGVSEEDRENIVKERNSMDIHIREGDSNGQKENNKREISEEGIVPGESEEDNIRKESKEEDNKIKESTEEGNMMEESEVQNLQKEESLREKSKEDSTVSEDTMEEDNIREDEKKEGNLKEESESSIKEFSSSDEADLPQLDGANDKKRKKKTITKTTRKKKSMVKAEKDFSDKLMEKSKQDVDKQSSEDVVLPDSDEENLVIATEEEIEDKVNQVEDQLFNESSSLDNMIENYNNKNEKSKNSEKQEIQEKKHREKSTLKKDVDLTPTRRSRRISLRESNVFPRPKRGRLNKSYVESDSSEDEVILPASLKSSKKIENITEDNQNNDKSIQVTSPVNSQKTKISKTAKKGKKSIVSKTKKDVKEKIVENTSIKKIDKTPIKETKEKVKPDKKVLKMNKILTSTPIQKSLPSAKKSREIVQDTSITGDLLGQILGNKDDTNLNQTNIIKENQIKDQEIINMEDENPVTEKELQTCEDKFYFYKLLTIGGIRLLLRGSTDGCLNIRPSVDHSSYMSNVNIRTKLEYQAQLGFELMTPEEACKEWLTLKFAPQPCTVIRCRVNPLNETLIAADLIKNVNERNAAYLACGFSQIRSNKLLLTILQKLTNLQNYTPGSYILYHGKTRKIINVRKELDDSAPKRNSVLYNLKQEYENPGRFIPSSLQTISWLPLDSERQTLWQVRNNRVPLLFDTKGGNNGNDQKTKKKKRNKGKPKRRNQ